MKILIIDIETTHLSKDIGKIVEVGIASLDIETGEREMLFDKVVHERPITRREVETSWIVKSGYMNVTEIRESKQLKEYTEEIQAIIDAHPSGITAYRNVFDFGWMESRGFNFPTKLDCPMLILTPIMKLPKKRGQGFKFPSAKEAFAFLFPDEPYKEVHRGGEDAYVEAKIVHELIVRGHFNAQI
jgi:DNA polymerase-3 subunit epsilon